jgi:hypothetical protein
LQEIQIENCLQTVWVEPSSPAMFGNFGISGNAPCLRGEFRLSAIYNQDFSFHQERERLCRWIF